MLTSANVGKRKNANQYPAAGQYQKHKPITEYKAISELTKLGNDNTVFKDWKVKMRDGMEQVYQSKDFLSSSDLLDQQWIGRN